MSNLKRGQWHDSKRGKKDASHEQVMWGGGEHDGKGPALGRNDALFHQSLLILSPQFQELFRHPPLTEKLTR